MLSIVNKSGIIEKLLIGNSRNASSNFKLKIPTLNIPETTCNTLESGIRVITENRGTPTSTVGIWINEGSRYEDSKTNGMAHFVQHMFFKGTSNRNKCQLECEIENLGARLNAVTNRETTVLYSRCLSKDVPQLIEILGDIIKNSTFDPNDIECEKKLIFHEIQKRESNFKKVIFDYLHMTAYQGTPLANTLFGPTENIEKINDTDLKNYVKDNYCPERMAVVGVGSVDHDQLCCLIETYLDSCKSPCPVYASNLSPCRFTGSEMRVRDDSIPKAHIAIAVEGVGCTNPDLLSLSLASIILGSWDSIQISCKYNATNLARASCEGHLSHSFKSFNFTYKDTGLWGIYFVSDYLKIEDMLFNVQSEFMRLCTTVTSGEVERAKAQFIKNSLLQLDSSDTTFHEIGRQIICCGKRKTLNEIFNEISSITAKHIREVCFKYIYDKCPAVAAIGPVENLPDYNRICASMYWLRV